MEWNFVRFFPYIIIITKNFFSCKIFQKILTKFSKNFLIKVLTNFFYVLY